jgi:hypothetical protein
MLLPYRSLNNGNSMLHAVADDPLDDRAKMQMHACFSIQRSRTRLQRYPAHIAQCDP